MTTLANTPNLASGQPNMLRTNETPVTASVNDHHQGDEKKMATPEITKATATSSQAIPRTRVPTSPISSLPASTVVE